MSSFETFRERGKNLLIYGSITAMTGAAILGAGGSVFAQDPSTPTAGAGGSTEVTAASDRQAEREADYAAFLEALAINLGVADGETVDAAIRTTLKQMIDQRLAAGEISADLAAELKAAIDAGRYLGGFHIPGFGGFDGHGGPRGDEVRGSDRDGDANAADKADDAPDDTETTDETLVPDPSTPTAGSEVSA